MDPQAVVIEQMRVGEQACSLHGEFVVEGMVADGTLQVVFRNEQVTIYKVVDDG